ncbi:hypothetical protein V1512DRAFT_209678, partial [Lipomyces arxii]|uniref:uncharacterized protein n=1 Tax=Lipomyces arxii TaxID=56418 RepID=UPI0034CFDD3E
RDLQIQNLFRITGVTAFKVADPSNNGFGEDLIGIRIESFALKKFASPNYIILAKNDKTGGYIIHKHTIPLHIPLNTLASKYLDRNMKTFVRKVHHYVVLDLQKRSILSTLRNVVSIEADEACEIIKLDFEFANSGRVVAYLKCDFISVLSAVAMKISESKIRDDVEPLGGDFENENLVRDAKLEMLMVGKIDELQARISDLD